MIKNIYIKWWDSSEVDINKYKVGELDKAIKDFVTTQKEELDKLLENGFNGDLTSGMELWVNGSMVMKTNFDINSMAMERATEDNRLQNLLAAEKEITLSDLRPLMNMGHTDFINEYFDRHWDSDLSKGQKPNTLELNVSNDGDVEMFVTFYVDQNRINIVGTETDEDRGGFYKIDFDEDGYRNGDFEYE